MKPLAILPRITHSDYPEDIEINYDITGNESGWMTGDILKNWVENQFVQEILQVHNFTQSDEPVLVLLDNHSSRSCIDFEFMWNQYKIFFFSFLLIHPIFYNPWTETQMVFSKDY